MNQEELGRVRYEYETDPDLRLNYAHGVWGGVTPHGEVEINFYTETSKVPGNTEYVIAPNGSLEHDLSANNDDIRIVVRHIHSKIIMNANTARAFASWLENKIDSLAIDQETLVDLNEPGGFHQ